MCVAPVAVNQHVVQAANPPSLPIEENWMPWKVLSALIPVAGPLVYYFQENSLRRQLPNATPARVVELIQIKNDYKVANIINNVVTCTLIIFPEIAKGVLRADLLALTGLGIVFGGMIGLTVYHIYRNGQLIEDIQIDGRVPQEILEYVY